RRTVDEGGDRPHPAVAVELEHVGAGAERRAVGQHDVPRDAGPVVVEVGCAAGGDGDGADLGGELPAELDQRAHTGGDADRGAVLDVGGGHLGGEAPLLVAVGVPEGQVGLDRAVEVGGGGHGGRRSGGAAPGGAAPVRCAPGPRRVDDPGGHCPAAGEGSTLAA